MSQRDTLATVDGREIARKDVEVLLSSLNPQTAAQFQSEEGTKNLVGELVNQELFYLDALENGLDREPAYLEEVERAKSGILKQHALNRLLNQAAVTEDEILAFYTANQARFGASAGIKASHILVDSEEKAQSIAGEIKEGLAFADAAKKYSSCPSNQAGGDLGFFSHGSMVPEFEAVAFALEIGEMSAPVKTQFGWHLIKVTDKREAASKSLDEVRDQVARHLMSQKQQELYQQKVSELMGKHTVKVNI